MMKQLGINQEEIEATRVIIEREDGNLVIEEPQVAKVTMQGQVTWQIVGDVQEEEQEEGTTEEDVKMVMQQAEADEAMARAALEETDGDIAEAIMKLKS